MTEAEVKRLIEKAVLARKNAYTPYSRFSVGAAILTKSGEIYTGCNVENSSYSLTVCAERIALFKAVSEGETRFLGIAVAADTPRPVVPCGACRQVLSEFDPDMELILVAGNGSHLQTRLREMFPSPFDATYFREKHD